MPKPPREDVGVEDDTVEVTEEMIEVISVDDMSVVVDMGYVFGLILGLGEGGIEGD